MMKIAKEFSWEMAHRLPFHRGKCKHLHGHSYRLLLEVQGELDEHGMVIDYYNLYNIVLPIIDNLDHSTLVCKNDKELIKALEKLNSKVIMLDYHSTAENICRYLLKQIMLIGLPPNISAIKARVYETEDAYAEEELIL